MSGQGTPLFMVTTTYGLGNSSCPICPWTDGGSNPATYFWAEKSKVSNPVVGGNYFTDHMTDFGLMVMVFNFYPCMTPDPGIIGEDGITFGFDWIRN
jgi:hypothetical protein